MKTATTALIAAAGLASASPIVSRQTETTQPFQLSIAGSNYTGEKLGACHIGAGFESMCVGYNATFTFNTTDAQNFGNDRYGVPGKLVYELNAGSNISQAMFFYSDPSTDVAMPIFGPGDTQYTQVAFDDNQEMNVQSALNDTVNPPTFTNTTGYYRWYVCKTNYEGYVYENLAWLYGNGTPENPTCQKVSITREFLA